MRYIGSLLLGLALLSAGSSPSPATVFVVDASGAGDFTTIQEAVNAAVGRDTILIRAGVYEENILCTGKYLTFRGEGSATTIVRGVSDAPTIELRDMTAYPYRCRFYDLTVETSPSNEWTVYWNCRRAELYRCILRGFVGSWESDEYGGIRLTDCTAVSARGSGYGSASIIERCDVDSLRFRGQWGNYAWSTHEVRSSDSEIDVVRLEGATLKSTGDVISVVRGGLHADCIGTNSSFGSIRVGSDLYLDGCTVAGDASLIGGYAVTMTVHTGRVKLSESLVEGNLTVHVPELGGMSQTVWARLWHNTILGDFTCDYDTWEAVSEGPEGIRDNIVLGTTLIDVPFMPTPVVTHNDFVGGFTVVDPGDSVHSNVSLPPLFCDPACADYSLQDCSPCVGTAHDGGDIGAFGVGCECVTAVREETWGRIKSLFR
jgi:hypothetical protein